MPDMLDRPSREERDAATLLGSAVRDSSGAALEAWAATGPAGVEVLRRALLEPRQAPWPTTSSRDGIDNLSAAVSAIAARNPDAFLDAFADPAFDLNSFVVEGLGAIDDDRATARLFVAAQRGNDITRIAAAVGLGHRSPSAQASAVLVELLQDPEYLVRYHALTGLARVGLPGALPRLRLFDPPTVIERGLTEEAIVAIERRA